MTQIADEWIDLNFQTSLIEDSALQSVLRDRRNQVMLDFEKNEGPQALAELKRMIRERRKRNEPEQRTRQPLQEQLQIIRPRFHEHRALTDVKDIGPFLNSDEFFAAQTHPENNRVGLYNLKTQSFTKSWSHAELLNTRPVGLSPDSEQLYLLKKQDIVVLNLNSGQVEIHNWAVSDPGQFVNAQQSADRLTLLFTYFRQGRHLTLAVNTGQTGKFDEVTTIALWDQPPDSTQSPDGQLVLQIYKNAVQLYNLESQKRIPLPKINLATTTDVQGSFSSDSRNIWLIETDRSPFAPEHLTTWDATTGSKISRTRITGKSPNFSTLTAARPGRDAMLVLGLAPSQVRKLYLIDTQTAIAKEFDFLELPGEQINAAFLSHDRQSMFVDTVLPSKDPQTRVVNRVRRLYEIDLRSLSVIRHLPHDVDAPMLPAITSPGSDSILIPRSGDDPVISIR